METQNVTYGCFSLPATHIARQILETIKYKCTPLFTLSFSLLSLLFPDLLLLTYTQNINWLHKSKLLSYQLMLYFLHFASCCWIRGSTRELWVTRYKITATCVAARLSVVTFQNLNDVYISYCFSMFILWKHPIL